MNRYIKTVLLIGACCLVGGAATAGSLAPMARLGKLMYQDKDFSYNRTQSCLTCHHPPVGFADPDNHRNSYMSVYFTTHGMWATGPRRRCLIT